MTSPDETLRSLAALARAVGSAVAPTRHDELLQSLTDTARSLFNASACSLAVLTDDEEELHYVAASGEGAETVIGMRIPATQGIAGWVMQSGQQVAVADVTRDVRFARDVAESTGYLPEAILAVPVSTPRGQIGVLSLLDRDATRAGAQFDLTTASLFADQAALAIESATSAADVGKALLTALADVAEPDRDLADALNRAADGPHDDQLLAVASLLAELGRRSPADLRLATRVLREFLSAGRDDPQ